MDVLDSLGYKKIILKHDQEPAIRALSAAVRERWGGESVVEESPAYHPQANGAIERTVRSLKEQYECLRLALIDRLKVPIDSNHPVHTWLVEYASSILRRNRVGNDGKSALERLKGRRSRRHVPEFGEAIMFLPLVKIGESTGTRAYPGIYLGIRDRSDELIIVDGEGVVRARDFRR